MDILHSIYEVAQIEYKKCKTDELLDINRRVVEPYVYQYLQEIHGPMLQHYWKTYLPPTHSEHVFVIAERRAHPNFRFILQNIAWAAPHMAVYLFCSDENQAFLEALVGDKKEHYHIIPVFCGNPNREQGKQAYNNLLTDYRFYELIPATYMLTIQLDNIIRKKIDPAMFTGEYWGNPWSWNKEAAGGGGATIRNIQAMITMCKTHRPCPDEPFLETEDVWCCEHTTVFPSFDIRSNYIMESVHVEDPTIVHQFWTFSHCFLSLPRDQFAEYWKNVLHIG
jgi:hypothetical protein